MAKQKGLSLKYQVWIDARKRFHLSHVHVQMARELGMNPKKFGKLANHRQEPNRGRNPCLTSSSPSIGNVSRRITRTTSGQLSRW